MLRRAPNSAKESPANWHPVAGLEAKGFASTSVVKAKRMVAIRVMKGPLSAVAYSAEIVPTAILPERLSFSVSNETF